MRHLIDKADGSLLQTIASPDGPIFAQPVFAAGELLVAGDSLNAHPPGPLPKSEPSHRNVIK